MSRCLHVLHAVAASVCRRSAWSLLLVAALFATPLAAAGTPSAHATTTAAPQQESRLRSTRHQDNPHTAVRVANGSFSAGVRHWMPANQMSRLQTAAGSPRDRFVTVTSKNAAAGLQMSRPTAPLKFGVSAVSLTLRAMANARSSSLIVQLTDVRGTRRHTVTRRAFRGRGQQWQRLTVKRDVHLKAGTRLEVSIVRHARGHARRPLAIDDVALAVTPVRHSSRSSTWKSGASGDGVADGTFGQWRGAPVTIAGTWNDGYSDQPNQWTLRPGFEYGSWNQDIDVAIGAIYSDHGETWASAAAGAYDSRWTQALQTLATAWAGRPGTMYIRFAHEFNGEWEPWSVHASDVPAFKAAWARFRALQQQIFPASKLVFCPTSDTSSSLGLDWRDAFPGRSQVDVLSVDYYNQWPFVDDPASFDKQLNATQTGGAPRGLEAFRAYAAAHGLPMAVSEWSTNADMGDAAGFVRSMHRWLADHAGSGKGKVLYDILFNVGSFGSGQFQLFPRSSQPAASSAYAAAF